MIRLFHYQSTANSVCFAHTGKPGCHYASRETGLALMKCASSTLCTAWRQPGLGRQAVAGATMRLLTAQHNLPTHPAPLARKRKASWHWSRPYTVHGNGATSPESMPAFSSACMSHTCAGGPSAKSGHAASSQDLRLSTYQGTRRMLDTACAGCKALKTSIQGPPFPLKTHHACIVSVLTQHTSCAAQDLRWRVMVLATRSGQTGTSQEVH